MEYSNSVRLPLLHISLMAKTVYVLNDKSCIAKLLFVSPT